ncbi:ArsR/SmtB family transcription factor [Demequina iriomotensis]|uniref:ArsR/SmtB family transcription factor n=1 Tax=Demequina iriomotensis TaxID=1536641 RepID=UPI000780A83C|nr:metalloregulator ArsR/SmtB family transcription factor [Demequina iriomotensis]
MDSPLTALAALAHPVRFAMIDWLVPGGTHAGDLSLSAQAAFGISPARASQHLGVLARAELVDHRPDGTWRWYSINDGGGESVAAWLAEVGLSGRGAGR